jgi:hypothetical protein
VQGSWPEQQQVGRCEAMLPIGQQLPPFYFRVPMMQCFVAAGHGDERERIESPRQQQLRRKWQQVCRQHGEVSVVSCGKGYVQHLGSTALVTQMPTDIGNDNLLSLVIEI